ncbi:ABC-2 type transport system permease protein [Bacillus mesophilus]|uniref:ABC transporter permease n=1 Tax=Bacillus mesophilus TaxID=1808955 RepID=A0A6M0Q6Q2_9BACI|nr:ABC transporter permease [Bacillus mesophilus]MBM7659919.1 ABC-2 type transport system permease protein [Bacillus mesophilus]NEY70778.1 ABC transporter permease [Bacillus mesophilus]
MDINNIWSQRFSNYLKELSRYMKYMFNDHLMIVVLIAVSAGAVYYNQWLSQLPEAFPYEWIMGIVLGIVITASSIRSFLKEPDLVFLLPVEHKMSEYFKKGIVYSFVIHSLTILVTFIVLVPMLNQFTDNSLQKLLVLYFIMLVLKGWNLFLSWRMFHIFEQKSSWFDYLIRLAFTTVFLVLLLGGAPFIYMLILLVIGVIWAASYYTMTKGKSVKWELLIDAETKLMNRFYRLANLFVDVPHLRSEVKPRRWLDWISASIPLKHDHVFDFLYIKTFIRTGEYLGLYIRLLIISGFILYGVHFEFASLVIVPFFIYISGLQLITMYKQHDQKLWLDLYPTLRSTRELAFQRMLFKLMIGYVVLLSLLVVFLKGPFVAAICAIVSALFSYVFVYKYVKAKLIKQA